MKRTKNINEDLIKVGLFIIFDSLVFHEVVASLEPNIKSLKLAPSSNISEFLKREWEKILCINYKPIFSLAHSILLNFPSSLDVDLVLKNLIEVALGVMNSGVLLRHDLMGRVYHKILLKTTGKYYATYYTSIPAAWLLSDLTIHTPNRDLNWNFETLKNIKKFRVIDPACGSGTLLSGIYMSIKQKYILDRYNSRNPELLDLNEFHKIMLENVINGWDVLDYAGHLTLTTLALHNPSAFFKRSNIYTLEIGKNKGWIHLGSLDWFEFEMKEEQDLPVKGFSPYFITGKGISGDREEIISFSPESCDVVIMNPPFSRSAGKVNVKFGFENKKIMKEMNNKLKKLGRILNISGIGQAGLGAYFIVLADKLVKKGGRIALVIPRAILSGVSWKKIREEIFFRDYEIEYIVSNFDPGDKDLSIEPWNWSENTDLGEILMVARKTKKPLENRYTTYINLWNKPKNEIESLKISSEAIKVRKSKNYRFLENLEYKVLKIHKEIGVIFNISQKHLSSNFLFPCVFAHPYLNELGFTLITKSLIPLIPLSKITNSFGVDRKQIESNFKLVTHNTPYSILWGHPDILVKLELESYHNAIIKKNSAKKIFQRRGNLLIAERIWTSSLRIISIFSKLPILATMFWEIKVEEETAKILSMWFNSTFGFILTLSSSINNKGNWFNLKKEQLANLLVLNISRLSEEEKKNLLSFFSTIKDTQFASFPEEFKLASEGKGIRKRIDDEFLKILKIELDLKPYYKMLAKEPILTLKRL